MRVEFRPSVLYGNTEAPPSKSLAHRSLICAAFSEKPCTVSGIDPSEDVLATVDCLKALGKRIELKDDTAVLSEGKLRSNGQAALYCRESGSTLRFFLPIALALGGRYRLYGSETLLKRPMTVYEEICREHAIEYIRHDDCIEVNGRLSRGTYTLRSDISSQFITGLILALSLLGEDSKLNLIPPVVSRAYIDLTMDVINRFGTHAAWEDETTVSIFGNTGYDARDLKVEGDYSNAAFLDAFNLLGGKVNVRGLEASSVQGDKIYKQYFEELKNPDAVIDIDACPDLGPVLFAAASALHGGVFTGTRRLKIKESDRCEAMKTELLKFGIRCINEEDRFTVLPGNLKKPEAPLYGHNDHRIVMALSVLLSKTGGVIEGCEAVRKSFPGFFEKIKTLHAEFDVL